MKLFALLAVVIGFMACTNQENKKEESQEVTDKTSEKVESEITNPDPAHTSQNALDWEGVYQGEVPCADCEGIQTEIKLFGDKTYLKSTKYLGKDETIYTSKGNFTWSEDGRNVNLVDAKSGDAQMYKVGENVLIHLDQEGNKITGSLATMYRLQKANANLSGKYWRLVELYGKPMDKKAEAYLVFNEKQQKVYGNAGCNTINGSFNLEEGSRISFGEVASTLMACADMSIEDQFKQMLANADNYAVSADGLSIHKAKMAPLARFEVDYFQTVISE